MEKSMLILQYYIILTVNGRLINISTKQLLYMNL